MIGVSAVAAGAALTASMLGHGLTNLVMNVLSPLVVSVAYLLMPLLAMTQGYVLGLQGAPTALLALAVPLIIYGAFLTSVGSRERGLGVRDALCCRLGAR